MSPLLELPLGGIICVGPDPHVLTGSANMGRLHLLPLNRLCPATASIVWGHLPTCLSSTQMTRILGENASKKSWFFFFLLW